jgi:hypothetical protein
VQNEKISVDIKEILIEYFNSDNNKINTTDNPAHIIGFAKETNSWVTYSG